MSRAHRYLGFFLLVQGKLHRRGSHLQRRFEPIRDRFYRRMWSESARAAGATIEDLGDGLFRIMQGNVWTFVKRSEVTLDSQLMLEIAGDKPLCHRLLRELGVPTPEYLEFRLDSLDAATAWLEQRPGPIVVKPAAAGSAGDGVTTGVTTARGLRRAAWRAATQSARLMAERQVEGDSYRLTYVGGTLLDAIRRNRPRVVGDGRATIRQLVDAENQRRLHGEVVSLHPLEVDLEMKNFLRSQGRRLSDVPTVGEIVVLKRVANQNRADENESVRDRVHPEIVRLGATIAAHLRLEVVGLDVLTTDISLPLSATGGVVNEINTTPGLHHHYLISDRSRIVPIADAILAYVLRRSGDSTTDAHLAREPVRRTANN